MATSLSHADPLLQVFYEEWWRKLKKKANVIGFDSYMKPKIQDGYVHRDWEVIRIYVEKKLVETKLKEKDLIPDSLILKKAKICNLVALTDVVQIGKPMIPPLLRPLGIPKSTREDYRPLESGVSTMHEKGTACTLNHFFLHEPTNEFLQASNWHCFAMEGKANIGDNCLQRAPYDGGKVPDQVSGKFVFGVPINFETFACPFRNFMFRRLPFWTWLRPTYAENNVDISFASVDVNCINKIALETCGFGAYADPIEGDLVAKCGRTTDRTEGKWESTSVNINCQYSRGIGFMTDIAMALLKCDGGDSGSPMYKPTKPLTYNAALFAGSDDGRSFGCKISNIMNRAQVKLWIPTPTMVKGCHKKNQTILMS